MARSSSSSRSSSPSRSSSRSSSPTRSSSLSSKTSSNSNSSTPTTVSAPSVSPVPVQTKPSVMQDIMTTAAGVATGNIISNLFTGSSKKYDNENEKTKVVHVYEPYPKNTQNSELIPEKDKCYEEFEKYTKCVESEFNDCTILFTEFKKCFHKESE